MSKSSARPPQLNYADMLKRVEPLRNELQKLEDDAKDNQQKANEVEQMIRDLEASIARYKEEYAVLISEAQAIKADLAAVEAKVSPRGPATFLPTPGFCLGVNTRDTCCTHHLCLSELALSWLRGAGTLSGV